MYYKRLKEILEKKGITIKELAERIGYSEGGFHQSVKAKSFKISTFEAISKELDVPMTYWFAEHDQSATGIQGEERYHIELITHLQEKVADKIEKIELQKKMINQLEQIIDMLKDQISNQEKILKDRNIID